MDQDCQTVGEYDPDSLTIAPKHNKTDCIITAHDVQTKAPVYKTETSEFNCLLILPNIVHC